MPGVLWQPNRKVSKGLCSPDVQIRSSSRDTLSGRPCRRWQGTRSEQAGHGSGTPTSFPVASSFHFPQLNSTPDSWPGCLFWYWNWTLLLWLFCQRRGVICAGLPDSCTPKVWWWKDCAALELGLRGIGSGRCRVWESLVGHGPRNCPFKDSSRQQH